jgi:hypothetical protein
MCGQNSAHNFVGSGIARGLAKARGTTVASTTGGFNSPTQSGGPLGSFFSRIGEHMGKKMASQIPSTSPPPVQATSGGSTGLSIRTGSGTRVAARKKATARQSRTKRFTTR